MLKEEKMKEFVVYNGGTLSYNACDDPSVLKKGQIYEITDIDRGSWQTNFKLKGVRGTFNSVWFDEIKNVELAFSEESPVEGQRYNLKKVDINEMKVVPVRTSKVQSVQRIYGGYVIKTVNTVYLVKVMTF